MKETKHGYVCDFCREPLKGQRGFVGFTLKWKVDDDQIAQIPDPPDPSTYFENLPVQESDHHVCLPCLSGLRFLRENLTSVQFGPGYKEPDANAAPERLRAGQDAGAA